MEPTYSNKTRNEIIMSLVSIPLLMSDQKNDKSVRDLVEQLDYKLLNKANLESELETLLLEDSSKISDWLNWSENKRADKGWFIKDENGKYSVGYFEDNSVSKTIKYTNEAKACASFIVNEISSIME